MEAGAPKVPFEPGVPTPKPRWIIRPQYGQGVPTELTKMSQKDAAALLGYASPNFATRAEEWMPAVADIVGRAGVRIAVLGQP